MAKFLVGLHAVTAGLHEEDFGEHEVVLLSWAVVDRAIGKVVRAQSNVVQPRDVNANAIPDATELGLTEEQLKTAQPLHIIIQQLDLLVNNQLGGDVQLVTDGQIHLRQVLHPEACHKDITLAPYFYSFFDLKKEFKSFYRSEEGPSTQDMLNFLGMEPDPSTEFSMQQVQNMAKVIIRMLQEGHTFDAPEVINDHLEPGICTKNEVVDNNTVVRARGLPWQSSDQDIAKFFRGLNIVKGGVALCLSPQGRRNGEALVRFESQEHRDMALKRHKHHIGQRYIEVYRATGDDFVNVAGGSNNEAQAFLTRGFQVIVRMRGLPYDCTPKQVLSFFSSGGVNVLDGEQGVLFVKRADGRATGDAFVLFGSEEEADRALQKHREVIGARYIELFRSTTAEVQQVLNRCLDPRTYEPSPPLLPPPTAAAPLLGALPPGSRKDCIRLRGLPFEAQVEHILEFLGEHAKNIVYQGVHMVYNAQGQPSGEAFIQMDSEASAFSAAQQRHHRYMAFGKKQRYIEVFQCSVDDMTLVLSGGIPLPAQRPIVSSGGSMLPPPYGAFPYVQSPQIVPAPLTPRVPFYSPVFYWPYPSPPVSPSTYYPGTTLLTPAECIPVPRSERPGSDALMPLHEKARPNGNRFIELFMA